MKKESRGSQNFIFLQFLDAGINAFLSGLMREFGNPKTESGIHITVRGPYSRRIPSNVVAKFENVIRHDPIFIRGVDFFQNRTENVVYIRAHSDSLRQIWWKPDFSVKEFGFNPHITLHKTPDIEFARTISEFLKKENIELICHEFRLIPFTSKQGDLFPIDSPLRDRQFGDLSDHAHVFPDILHRAANVVEDYRRRCVNNAAAVPDDIP